MLKNQSKFQGFLREGFMSLEDYVMTQNMFDSGTWATEHEIIAMVDMLHVDICTFDDRNKWYKFSTNYLDKNPSNLGMAMYLFHRRRVHYDVVLSVTESTTKYVCDVKGQQNDSSKQTMQCDGSCDREKTTSCVVETGGKHLNSLKTEVNKLLTKTVKPKRKKS